MCQRATCPTCEKPTFSGCGRHVEQVLGDVPVEKRCQCREAKKADADGSRGSPSVIRRILGL